MLTFLEEQNPILLAFLATLFTYSVTLIGASIVFLFKKVKKNICAKDDDMDEIIRLSVIND